jgi:hypothetical protein
VSLATLVASVIIISVQLTEVLNLLMSVTTRA